MTAEEMTAEASGNTNAEASWRARAFQFTLNSPEKQYDGMMQILKSLKTCDYILAAREHAPSTDHIHIHIYAHFNQTYKLSKKLLSFNSHIEICKGSPKQNIAYLMKDGDIIEEIGEKPHQGIKSIKELKEANIDEVDPHLYNIKKRIDEEQNEQKTFFDMLTEIENDNLKAPEIIYIYGDSGRGKTYRAYKEALERFDKSEIGKITIENNFIKFINDNAECFVIEEFRSSQIHAASFLQLTDKYGFSCNIKGGFKTIRPKCIIIASIIKPEDLYRNEEVNKQFTRRITKRIDLGYDEPNVEI